MKDISVAKDKVEGDIVLKEKELAEVSRQMEDFNRAEEEKKKRIFALQEIMQEEQKKLNTILDERNEKQVAVAKLETRQEDLNNEVYQELHYSLEIIIEKGIELISPDELDELQQKIQKLKYQLSLIGGIDEEVIEEYKETKEKHDHLNTQLEDYKRP
jgi:chromosome segregation ATPase